MFDSYKSLITKNDHLVLYDWHITMPDLQKIQNNHWCIPYGDGDEDIYEETALRSSTLGDEVKSQGWSGLVLKNSTGDHKDSVIQDLHPSYDSISDLIQTYKKFKGTWTEVSSLVPEMTEFIKTDIEKYLFVGHAYILKVEPKGFIKEHRDVPSNYDEDRDTNYNMLNTFMAPLNDTDNSYFIHNKKQMPLVKHKVTWFNSSLPHLYFNMSNDSKYFLLFTGLARKSWIKRAVSDVLL